MLLDYSPSSLFTKTLSQWLFFLLTYFVLLQHIRIFFDKITNCLNRCGLIGFIKQSTLSCNCLAGIYLLKINKRNAVTWCEICSKLIIKTPERQQCRSILAFRDWLFYNLIIIIMLCKNRGLNLYKALLFPRNQAICLKNWKLCQAENLHTFPT